MQELEQEGVLGSRYPRVMSTPLAPTALADRDKVVAMRVFNVSDPKGFQRRSKLEKGMRDWFDNGEATTNKCVLCGPGGIGKSTLVYTLCVCIYIYKNIMSTCICWYQKILAPGALRHDALYCTCMFVRIT